MRSAAAAAGPCDHARALLIGAPPVARSPLTGPSAPPAALPPPALATPARAAEACAEAPTVKRAARFAPSYEHDAACPGDLVKVGDYVTVCAKAGRWMKPYLSHTGMFVRWWTHRSTNTEERLCVVAFPDPIGARILHYNALAPAAPRGAEGHTVLQYASPDCGTQAAALRVRRMCAVDTVLNDVVRSEAYEAHQKLVLIDELCQTDDGALVAQALTGNGWNSVLCAIDGYPVWPRAIAKLSAALSLTPDAESGGQAPPTELKNGAAAVRARKEKDEPERTALYVSVGAEGEGGELFAQGCCALQPHAYLLRDSLRLAALTTLDLSEMGIRSTFLKTLLKSMLEGDCLCLKRLNLSGNPLQDQGAAALVPLLQDRPSPSCRIEVLDVSRCHLWTRGCMTVVSASTRCSHLRYLSLAGNDVGAPTCSLIAQMFRVNHKLLELDISNAGVTAPSMETLAAALAHNDSIQALSLGGNTPMYEPAAWGGCLRLNPYIVKLVLPALSPQAPASATLELRELCARGGGEPALPVLEMQIALCMGSHRRLGEKSAVLALSDAVLFDILRLAGLQRRVTVVDHEGTQQQHE